MFDADTVALIRRAPVLDGLDLDALPQRLTDAYASIVAARIRTRRTATTPATIPDATAQTVAEMQRLAFALEGLLSAVPEREDRAAAGFVAGTAHHVALLAERVTATAPRPSTLSLDGISPEVSATLLFLIAEATADAAEVSKAISIGSDDAVERALLEAVQHLANGRLAQLLDADTPPADAFLQTSRANQGVRALYYMLLHGVRRMAELMLGRQTAGDNSPYTAAPQALFEQVKSLSVDPFDDLFIATDTVPTSLFPGPLHMASLLSVVSRDLAPSALASLPPPGGIDRDGWAGAMRNMAHRRPYLWRNHRQAIEAGYLERGVSSVVSFPTGAGKSTLAELKITAALLSGEKVVFLAPTLALVDQTATALRKTFPHAKVQRAQAEESLIADTDELPEVAVLTPEQCLTRLSFQREVFEGVGLMVFDECHLLHPQNPDNSRRAVDAMLCVLNFATIAPAADFLFLSAMMMNAQQIAAWLEAMTQRRCLPLELTWKPTRQVRGCVVYGTKQIKTLQGRLRAVRPMSQTANPPAALRRELQAQPFGFFCLRQTWYTSKRDDYALLRLLEEPVPLATGTAQNGEWYLTPNGNQVAAAIAAATAAKGLKTLVFTQTIPLATAAARRAAERLSRPDCVLTPEERVLYEAALEEVGAAVHLYLEVDEDCALVSPAAAHHGLLLPAERRLHESLFKRPDGIDVLVATSTLAQGMNLPSEVVIIAGDSRFDAGDDRLRQLEAYELLNAAGRAGRAGENSYGFVLVVPSKVVHFDEGTNRIQHHWASLQAIFSRSDACIAIEDPLVPLLDEIHAAAAPLSAVAEYMIRRLPRGAPTDDEDLDTPARGLLAKSLGAFLARARNDEAWVDSRVEAALAARRVDPTGTEDVTWAEQLAAAAGLPVAVISALRDWLSERSMAQRASVCDWRDAVFDWLEERPELIPAFLRRDGLEGLLGTPFRRLQDESARGQFALPVLKKLTREWMAGSTLVTMEIEFGTPKHRLGNCKAAREFILRVIPELAYLFGLANQVIRASATEQDFGIYELLSVETLGSCVRGGFDCPEKVALRWIRGGRFSRVGVHRDFAQLSGFLDAAPELEDWRGLRRRVQRAVDACEKFNREWAPGD